MSNLLKSNDKDKVSASANLLLGEEPLLWQNLYIKSKDGKLLSVEYSLVTIAGCEYQVYVSSGAIVGLTKVDPDCLTEAEFTDRFVDLPDTVLVIE